MAENKPQHGAAGDVGHQDKREEKDAAEREVARGVSRVVMPAVVRGSGHEAQQTLESPVEDKAEPDAKDKAKSGSEVKNAATHEASNQTGTKVVALGMANSETEAKANAETVGGDKIGKETESENKTENVTASTTQAGTEVERKPKMPLPFPVSRTCHKCGKVLATRQSLMAHLNRVWPCDRKKPKTETTRVPLSDIDRIKARTCSKCGKTFPSKSGLRSHMVKLIPCDQAESDLPRPMVHGDDKTCPKCGHTFTTPHGLRLHMNRVTPCDQEPPPPDAPSEHQAKQYSCHKCGKVLKSRQSLQIHLNRVNPCDGPKVLPRDLGLEKEEKEEIRKERARQASRKAYRRRSQLLRELKKRIGWESSGSEASATPSEPMGAVSETRKRSGEDDSDASSSENKRPRPNVPVPPSPGPPAMLASIPPPAVKTGCIHPGSAGEVTAGTATAASNLPPVSIASDTHGGDLATDGCCCPVCLRAWARKMVARVQSLEREVSRLRGDQRSSPPSTQRSSAPLTQLQVTPLTVVGSASAAPAARSEPSSTSQRYPLALLPSKGSSLMDIAFKSTAAKPEHRAFVLRGNTHKEKPRALGTADGPVQTLVVKQDPQAAARRGGHAYAKQYPHTPATDDPMLRKLTDAYNHLNGQILLNEGAVEDSLTHLEEMMATDRVGAEEFRRQIEELRVSIDLEKRKRSKAAAAVLFAEWGTREDFDDMLRAVAAMATLDNDDMLHKRCAALASELDKKDKMLDELTGRIEVLARATSPDQHESGSRSRHEELGELSSKVAAELAAKTSLEIERRGVYMDLLKSSAEIRSLLLHQPLGPKAAAA